jgi:hypothetical protein
MAHTARTSYNDDGEHIQGARGGKCARQIQFEGREAPHVAANEGAIDVDGGVGVDAVAPQLGLQRCPRVRQGEVRLVGNGLASRNAEPLQRVLPWDNDRCPVRRASGSS